MFLALAASGIACTSKGEKASSVSGTVNLDNQPLAEGEIMFVGEGGQVPDTLPIKNGAFSGNVKQGKKRVEIRAYRDASVDPAAAAMYKGEAVPGASTKENYLPARFNSESTLTAEVTASGLNPSKFDVTSK
jgi:hypothetical protein